MAVLISTFPLGAIRRRKLPLAAAAPLRVAQVTHPRSLFEEAQFFPPARGGGLDRFSPQVLVGSGPHLSILAEAVQRREIELPELRYALFTLTDCRGVPVSETTRALLWKTFGVPVYELLLDDDHVPIASECDAHEGWHVENGVTFFRVNEQLWFRWRRGRPLSTGLTGSIEDQPCACGRPGTRILNAELDFRDPIRARLSAIA